MQTTLKTAVTYTDLKQFKKNVVEMWRHVCHYNTSVKFWRLVTTCRTKVTWTVCCLFNLCIWLLWSLKPDYHVLG